MNVYFPFELNVIMMDLYDPKKPSTFLQEYPMLRIVNVFSLFVLILFLANPGKLDAAGNYDDLRRNLIRQIIDDVRSTSMYLNKTALDEQVMTAMSSVPRHSFVPKAYIRNAYKNRPLPIGEGQTISQPYIVAIMTDLLNLKPSDIVLEVGTGSGVPGCCPGKTDQASVHHRNHQNPAEICIKTP